MYNNQLHIHITSGFVHRSTLHLVLLLVNVLPSYTRQL